MDRSLAPRRIRSSLERLLVLSVVAAAPPLLLFVGHGLPAWRRADGIVSAGADFSAVAMRAWRPGRFFVRSALLGRRTVNSFAPKLPVDWEGALRRAVEAACFAPNHRRTEPWRFYLLGHSKIRGVCELNSELVSATKGQNAGAKKLERWLGIPGWLVVTQKLPDGSEGCAGSWEPGSILLEDYAACCCAVQNLCLSLHAEGIGTKWTTGPVNFHERFNDVAGIPHSERVVGTIWFGKASVKPMTPRKRFSVDDVLSFGD